MIRIALVTAALVVATTFGFLSSPGAQSPRKPVKHAVAPQYSATLTSANWSGYWAAHSIDTPMQDSVLNVSGSWQVPRLSYGLLETSTATSWVGMDGVTTPVVEQVGTWARCTLGSPNYGAWVENYPQPYVVVPIAVHAGDLMTASVAWDQHDLVTYNLTDVTTGRGGTASYPWQPGAAFGSAEWITEANTIPFGILPLANFKTQYWANCRATIFDNDRGQFVDAPIGDASRENQQIFMATSDGTVRATPSSLSPHGGSFSIQWGHS
jgi:hypothetical protein